MRGKNQVAGGFGPDSDGTSLREEEWSMVFPLEFIGLKSSSGHFRNQALTPPKLLGIGESPNDWIVVRGLEESKDAAEKWIDPA